LWAIALHGYGRSADALPSPLAWLAGRLYWPAYRLVETLTGISLPKSAPIGPGLRIYHFGGIVVHDRATIGANCTLRHGVTIGDRVAGGAVPVIEDDVDIGAYAQILGGVRIGRGAKIGAMSVVLVDVPPGATAVGNPARVILRE
jgi:serine O-acetyltransferase